MSGLVLVLRDRAHPAAIGVGPDLRPFAVERLLVGPQDLCSAVLASHRHIMHPCGGAA